MDFRLEFSLWGFCILHVLLSEFLIKNVWDTTNPTYLIGYCNRTPFLTCPKSNFLCFVPIFYITHKMGCCRYCYCLGWYNLLCVTLGRHNYPLFRYQFIGCYYVTTTFFVCLFIRDPQCPYSNFYFFLVIFVLQFCVPGKYDFFNVFQLFEHFLFYFTKCTCFIVYIINYHYHFFSLLFDSYICDATSPVATGRYFYTVFIIIA